MATPNRTTGLTYQDLQRFPDDNLRREIIDGALLVTPSPTERHQLAVAELLGSIWVHVKQHGGRVYPPPLDVYFSENTVVEPDVLFVAADNAARGEERFIRGAPDLVVEVSSPSTRRTDQGRKRDLYERYLVPEYWFVDLDADRIEVHRLNQRRYPKPTLVGRSESLTSPLLPGLSILVDDVLGEA